MGKVSDAGSIYFLLSCGEEEQRLKAERTDRQEP
jgi:hypothetical protein